MSGVRDVIVFCGVGDGKGRVHQRNLARFRLDRNRVIPIVGRASLVIGPRGGRSWLVYCRKHGALFIREPEIQQASQAIAARNPAPRAMGGGRPR